MALKSVYEVLREKEEQLQKLQQLLNEAQAVLGRVLEFDTSVTSSEQSAPRMINSIPEIRPLRNGTTSWNGNGSTEFP